MKKSISIAVIFLLVASLSFAQKTINKSFTGVKRIKLQSSSGDCEIRKGSGNSVEVELVHTLDEGQFTPRFEQSGERLDLGEQFRGNNFNGSVRWKISIPDGIKVTFSTGSGDLTVDGVAIDLNATSGSGDLEFSTVKGTVDATTGSGDVDLAAFNGEAKINTGSGNMDVRDSEGDIDLNCGSGDIKLLQTKAFFSVNTGSGNISADKVTITGISRFNTGSGRAKIALAATPKFDLSVNSGSGDAIVDFSGNEIAGEIVMKASKTQGNISAPFEFDKTEEVENGGGRNNVTVVKTAQVGKATNRITIGTGSGDAILRK
jgi:DUF4097 and DUF4098 domain-containing protein YvlB